jgi:hypothetical protein
VKADLLRRLQAVEAALAYEHVKPLAVVDVLKMSDDDRSAYWNGDDAILTRYGARHGQEGPAQGIHTLVIDMHESARQRWLATRNLSDEELEAQDLRQLNAEQEAERSAAPAAQAATQSVWGYSADGQPIYDNDPRLAHLFRNRLS